ncbi:hypothetical protein PHISCL_00914 [Aspergillus sclerotialis]|uniref:Fe2OG dioxygenase domain-containing protein n=1 Tax=Aspergillus sclerotialis TaxID=2070753 RepID=A0A3A2ZUG3_9EURO|nr:hypothetical protein PHISCL_00914 [Aspergillus sclerotialis]
MSKEFSRILPGLLGSLSEVLQLDLSLNQHRGEYEDSLCLHHYPVTKRVERNPAHKDFGILTLLIQEHNESSNGLEIADLTSTDAKPSLDINDNARFVPVYPEADDIIVFVGISLKRLARKAQFTPGVHRVVAPPDSMPQTSRYSIAYFVHPDARTKLDGKGETAGEYLRRRRELSHISS